MEQSASTKGFMSFTAVLLLCLTLFGTTYYVIQNGVSIRSTGQTVTSDGRPTNTISVNGEGKVYATPDMVEINIAATELSKTTKEAQTKVNERIQQVLGMLKQAGIADKDIQTVELSLTPEYDYGTYERSLKGQRATQRLNVKIKNITPASDKITSVIDQVSQLNGIEVSSISYDIEDKTKLFSAARELAFQKAEQKAKELAALGSVSLVKPVSISDAAVDYYPPYYSITNQYAADRSAVSNTGGSTVPVGQLEISIRLDVTWGIQ